MKMKKNGLFCEDEREYIVNVKRRVCFVKIKEVCLEDERCEDWVCFVKMKDKVGACIF